MNAEQFDQLCLMLEAIHSELRRVVSENQMIGAQLSDVCVEIQRAIMEIE